jgi:hypothetical protein
MTKRILAAIACAATLCAAAQATPAANYTDLWFNPNESGWGLSFTQHAGSNQAYAVWYTYDPRETGSTGNNKPLWIVMTGGTWTSPTTITGTAYVANGMPFNQPGSNLRITPVGSFTVNFTTASTAQFSYNISAPSGLSPADPAYNLPNMSGTKSIQRQSF